MNNLKHVLVACFALAAVLAAFMPTENRLSASESLAEPSTISKEPASTPMHCWIRKSYSCPDCPGQSNLKCERANLGKAFCTPDELQCANPIYHCYFDQLSGGDCFHQ